MGDKPKPGVRVRSKSSIEIDFYFRGVRCREQIKIVPTPANINSAAKLKARIEHEIGTGEFDYKKHFPNSPRAALFSKFPGETLSVKSYFESWITAERENLKSSTWIGYDKIEGVPLSVEGW
jgi:integrase